MSAHNHEHDHEKHGHHGLFGKIGGAFNAFPHREKLSPEEQKKVDEANRVALERVKHAQDVREGKA